MRQASQRVRRPHAERRSQTADERLASVARNRNPDFLPSALAMCDGGTRAGVLERLQKSHGNQAVQRLLAKHTAVQRDGSATTAPPAPSPLQVISPWLEGHYYEANLWAGGLQPLDILVTKIQQGAPGAAGLSADQIRRAFLAWAKQHNVRPLPGTKAGGDVLRARLEDAVMSALSVAAEGVSVNLVEKKGSGDENKLTFQCGISVQGATAALKVGETTASVTAAYDKGVKASLGNDQVSFSAEMTPDSWSLKLNLGLDPEVPDLSSVGGVFDKAQRGLSQLLSHPEKASKDDVAAAMRSASDAFDAVQGIAKAPKLSASLGAGATDTSGGAPKGWQITVVVSGTF